MDITTFKKRKSARIVARVDIAFTCASMLSLAETFVMSIFKSVVIISGSKINGVDTSTEEHPLILTFLLVLMPFIVLGVIINACVEIWAVIKVLKATKQGTDLSEAIRKTLFWRNIMIGILTLGVVYCLITQSLVLLVVHVIVRSILLYFVIKFIKEMQDPQMPMDCATTKTA